MLPVFAAHGAKATFYVNSGLMGSNEVMTWGQAPRHPRGRSRDRGRPPHTVVDVDDATARAEIEADVTALQAQGFPRPVSFALAHRLLRSGGGADGRRGGLRFRPHHRHRPARDGAPTDPYAVRIVRDSLDGSEGLQALA